MGDFPIVREVIRHDVWDHLKEFSVGIIAKIADSKFLWSDRTVHYLLCIYHRVYKEILSLVVDQPIRFSLHEFNEITGLNIDPFPMEIFEPDQYKTPALEVYRSWTFEKRKWLGLLLFQTMGLYALHHNSRILFESAKIIFDDEAIMTYPWGQSAYEVLVNLIKMLSPQGQSYTINGLKDVHVRKMVMKESLQEQFPQWPNEGNGPQLVNLMTNIHAGRFVGSFWNVQRNKNKKRTKAEVSSASEAPKKKQKKEKKKKNVEEKVATKEATIAALKSIIITLDNISRKVDNYDDKFEMVDLRLIVYNSNFVDLARDISNIDKNIGDRVEAALVDVTDDHVEEEETIRSLRIKIYRERGAQLSPNGLAAMPAAMPAAVAPSTRVFFYIGDNGTKCMRKDIDPPSEIYDPISPADPVKIDKLMQHLQPFQYGPLHHFCIAFIDSWFLGVWVHDYPKFKLKPRQFKGTGYEELINGRIPVDVQTNLIWLQDVDHLYGVINIGGDHWVGFNVDLLKEKIDCYDPIIVHVTEESEQKVLNAFRPLTKMISAMMSEQFAFRRRRGKYIPQNDIVGDCGVYSLKFIECIVVGVTFDGISDQNIQGLRVKMAAEILDEKGYTF
ncbi:hypothetical protein N665_0032s0015 [Sinapis alba]|nr:hypothetical protein N665_0032s0015 [Sinapis alba]